MIDSKVWADQEEFNSLLRDSPSTEDSKTSFVREMTLNLFSETAELLRTTQWRAHRKVNNRPNREHRLEELTDLFKIWLTTAQGMGFSQQELLDAYWRKSMVVRQRHSEEFVLSLDRPAAVVDIDNVLADYTTGFCQWLRYRTSKFEEKAAEIEENRKAFSGGKDFGIPEEEWQALKHEFRVSGQKRFLPPMPHADTFTQRLKDAGYLVILLTSRPIDRYPNIYSDTVYWLDHHRITYDFLWWSHSKHERLAEALATKWVKFAIDDDPAFILQYHRAGITDLWWLQSTAFPYGSLKAVYELDPLPLFIDSLDNVHIIPAKEYLNA